MERGPAGRPELSPVEARQAFLGRPVLIVLTVSLVLIATALVLLMTVV